MIDLYQFSTTLNYSDLPASTQRLLRYSMLDIVGILAGARDNDTSVRLRQYALSHYLPGQHGARLLFDGRRVHPLGSAWAGGFSADSLDAHEGHFTSKGHAGATVVPALLAYIDAYEDMGSNVSGETFLSALAVAYETSLRAGVALMKTAAQYHASGAFSGLGVVCGLARLGFLNETAFYEALGIAEYFGPRCPMMRLVDHPSNLRDAHGAGAFAGFNAALLAREGITGAPAETFVEPAVDECWNDLGQRWEIDAQYYKPWPVCRWAQPALTAVTALMAQHPKLAADTITSIHIETFHESVRLQGHFPKNSDEAQYGLAFPVAALLARGQVGPNEVTGDAIEARDILELSSRIQIHENPELSKRFPDEILSKVCIKLTDGSELCSPIMQAKGDPDTAMTDRDFEHKFRLLAGTSLSDQKLDIISHLILKLETEKSCHTLLNHLTQAR